MKSIRLDYIGDYEKLPDLQELSGRLDKLKDRWPIDIINWEEFKYKPKVSFVIAYSKTEIFVKYFVEEEYIKAEKTVDNAMVCEDSCVEFFISHEGSDQYYNFEFNPIGICYSGSGSGRHNSSPIDAEKVKRIRRHSSLGKHPFSERKGNIKWELTIAIPTDLIFDKKDVILRGKKARANFYKCGDKLSSPHYLTWNKIDSKDPDYHRPEFFGELIFD